VRLKSISELLARISPSSNLGKVKREILIINLDLRTVGDAISNLVNRIKSVLELCCRLLLPREPHQNIVDPKTSEQGSYVAGIWVTPSAPSGPIILQLHIGQCAPESFEGAGQEDVFDMRLQ
jgi:hypothetical protein